MIKVALAGNPNCGKTTLFNALTGGHQHVGNYPGVTVEKKTGELNSQGKTFELIDLPGIYSITAYSDDELVARNYLLSEKPDVIINVLDAGNLERNLYLTVQLMEMGLPIIVALNMEDEAFKQGLKVDTKKLSTLLGIPVIPTVGHKKKGVDKLIEALVHFSSAYVCPQYQKISYGLDLDEAMNSIVHIIENDKNHIEKISQTYRPLWMALKLFEGDEEVENLVKKTLTPETQKQLYQVLDKTKKHLSSTLNDIAENVICDYRYGFASSVAKRCLARLFPIRKNVSDKIDTVLTHRAAGPFLLVALLLPLYQLVFKLSEYPTNLLEKMFGSLKDIVTHYVPSGLIQSLINSGIIDGVGGVLSFTPIIILMFMIVALIEDSGYMARIAFIMDRFLRTFGMHGSSILAYIIAGGMAGGCAVPGILATRTLRDPKERLATILTTPFMNCGAKLPVFALLIAAFFPNNQGMMMFLVTILSWVFALGLAAILRNTIIKGESTPFVMELPPYRWPTLKGLLIHTWERTFQYVQKAGTFILMAAIIIWASMTFPQLENTNKLSDAEFSKLQLEYSIAGRLGKAMEKVTLPLMGFEWETNIALIGGMAAKEIIISTLGIAHSLGSVEEKNQKSLGEKLATDQHWNKLVAFTLIIFIMLYMPCIATLSIIKKETQTWKWTIFAAVYTTSVAVIFSAIFYQIGRFLL